jgi:hypothetical protein
VLGNAERAVRLASTLALVLLLGDGFRRADCSWLPVSDSSPAAIVA